MEGEAYNFLFDSGAPMVISQELVEKFESQVVKTSPVNDSQGGRQYLDYVRMPDLKIGSRNFSGLVALAADLKKSPALNCLGIDGIIGANGMQFQYWDFSVEDTILRISSDKGHWPKGKKYILPFGMKGSRTPVVKLNINDTEVSGITFDTGSSGVLSLPKSITSAFKPEDADLSSWGYLSAGLFGSALDTAHEFEMRFVFPDTNYRFPVEQESKKDGKLLGMSFLRHFHVFMDFPQRQILLMPKEVGPSPSQYPMAPFYRDGYITIGMINTLLPEKYQDLAIGDTIIAYDNQVISQPAGVNEFCDLLQTFKENQTVNLELKWKGKVSISRQPSPL